MEMSEPDPSSAMMGSDVSQPGVLAVLIHSISEQRHVLSAMMTPAAPERCALRTCKRQQNINEKEGK
jgi:hypothetical protein